MQHIILRKLWLSKKSQIINQFDSPIVCEIIIISIETIQICFFHEVMAFDLIFPQSTIKSKKKEKERDLLILTNTKV